MLKSRPLSKTVLVKKLWTDGALFTSGPGGSFATRSSTNGKVGLSSLVKKTENSSAHWLPSNQCFSWMRFERLYTTILASWPVSKPCMPNLPVASKSPVKRLVLPTYVKKFIKWRYIRTWSDTCLQRCLCLLVSHLLLILHQFPSIKIFFFLFFLGQTRVLYAKGICCACTGDLRRIRVSLDGFGVRTPNAI